MSGELPSLLGGVLNGEMLWSVNSAGGSGAARLPDLFPKSCGLIGTLGLAARFTTGGSLVGTAFVDLASGNGNAGASLMIGESAACRNAAALASKAGVAALLMLRECDLRDSLVRLGVRGCNGVVPAEAEGRRSTEKPFWGERGESTVTRGGECGSGGLMGPIDDGLGWGVLGCSLRGVGAVGMTGAEGKGT